jgi:hypothetical protein
MDLYRDKECKWADKTHAHQGDDVDLAEMNVSEVIARIIMLERFELNIMVDNVGLVEMLKDKRGNRGYIAEQFCCANLECN